MSFFLAACSPAPTPSPSPSPATCLGFIILNDAPHTCQTANNRALIASTGEQITLEAYGASLVIQGQTELELSESVLTVRVFSGTAVVGAAGHSRVLTAAQSVEVPLVNGLAQSPNEIVPIEPTNPPIPIESNSEIIQSEATATLEGDCIVRADWRQTYTVQSGDVLSEIAETYNLRIDEIAQANCLADPSRLRIGQVLVIAGDAPTATPSAIAFRADSYSLQAGECTTLRWDVFNVAEVYLDGNLSELNSFLEICPTDTSSYTLRVIFLDGSESEAELTITVVGG